MIKRFVLIVLAASWLAVVLDASALGQSGETQSVSVTVTGSSAEEPLPSATPAGAKKPKRPKESPRPNHVRDDDSDGDDGTTVRGISETNPGPNLLPQTGAEIVLYLVIAFALIGFGSALVRLTRRRKPALLSDRPPAR
jgi:LPXTG-motif cell wall-anchored protein